MPGVKGMKWGVRKDKDESSKSSSTKGSSDSSVKPKSRNDLIKEARGRQLDRAKELDKAAFKTYIVEGDKAVKAANKKYEKLSYEILNNPDAAMANKMTTGEKAVSAAYLGAFGALVATTVLLNAARA